MANKSLVNERQFKFELVAPEKVEVAGLEERVLLPGELGDFMVLAGHTQLLAALRPGVVSLLKPNNSVSRYFITGGFADVGNTHCIVLTPHVIPVEKLSAETISADLEKTQAALESATEKHTQEHLQEELVLLNAKLEAVTKYA